MGRLVSPVLSSLLLAFVLAAPSAAAPPGTNVLVSRPPAFGPLTAPIVNDSDLVVRTSGGARVVSDADDHRFVAFVSDADGLSAEDDDSVTNVYVRDRLLDATILVSRADGPAGAGANASSFEPSITSNGRWVAFQSVATNLASGTTEDVAHIYVRDLIAGTTRLFDRADNPNGAIADDSSGDPSITATPSNPIVAFTSAATNLDGATGNRQQVYVRDAGTDLTTMVSRPDGETSTRGNLDSLNATISTDATTVAFESAATNLVSGDLNTNDDVFVRDLITDDTTVVSSFSNGDSRSPSISADGSVVAFVSSATNLSASDSNTRNDVYVRERNLAITVLASQGNGQVGDRESVQPSIAGSGGAVVFSSASTNLAPPGTDTNGVADVFLRDGLFFVPSTSVVSRPSSDTQSDGASEDPSISRTPTGPDNHNLVAFVTAADNMGADDDDFTQVYARATGAAVDPPNAARHISRPTGTGAFRTGVNASFLRSQGRTVENVSSVSADGRYTVFISEEDDLSAEDDDRQVNVFRRDNLTGETILVNRADGPAGAAAGPPPSVPIIVGPAFTAGAPAISADGNRIAFTSFSTNLIPGDVNASPDVFVRDVAAGTTQLVSRQPDGSPIPEASSDAAISGDGRRVAFVTDFAMDGDGLTASDVYLRDLTAGTTKLVSRIAPDGPPGNSDSFTPAVDADGSHVAFATSATNFSALPDANMGSDVWVRDLAAGSTTLVSLDAAGDSTANGASFAPAIDAGGNRVAFASSATDLGGGTDPNGAASDVFVRDVAAASTLLVSRTNGPDGVSGNSGSGRPAIDSSGTRIAFETGATDLFAGDANGAPDVLLRDTAAATTELVSRGQGILGAQQLGSAGTPSISGNGDCVAFETRSDDLVAMPPGTDFGRVIARVMRGDCPFGPPAGSQPAPAPQAADTSAPVVSGVSISPRRFLAGRRVSRRTRTRPAIGARLRFSLSEAATVALRIDRLRPGRRLRNRCVVPRRAPRGRRCTRALRRGTLTRAGAAGANRVSITGRLRGRKLPPAPYRIELRATDAAGNVSAPRRVKFRILRKR